MPTIKINLSEKSIDDAIAQVRAYREKIERFEENAVRIATEMGVETAKDFAMYMNAYDSGELVNGIIAEYKDGKGYVVSTAPHSAFVEMGTGVRGKEQPNPGDYIPGWTYDKNEYGEDGWFYIGKDGKRHWTKGMPSRPFMYETAKVLKESKNWIALQALKEGG